MDPTPEPAAPSLFAFRTRLDWARYTVALLATGSCVFAMVREGVTFLTIEAAVLGLFGLLMVLDRADVHVFLRALLWGCLAGSALLGAVGTELWPVGLSSGAALLALSAAGLDSSHGAFAPKVMRRSIVTMMVVGLSVAHVLLASAVLTELMLSAPILNGVALALPSTVFTRVTMFAAPLMLIAGVVGLSRTRSWGLLAYLGALAAMACTIGLPLLWVGELAHHTDELERTAAADLVSLMSLVWGACGVFAFGAALPVLSAIVYKRRPSSYAGAPWGRYAHAALVSLVMLGIAFLHEARP